MGDLQVTVGNATVTVDGGSAEWSVPISGRGFPEQLWFSVPQEHGHLLTERSDPALVALTIPALREGATLTVEGPVTEELAFWYAEIQAVYATIGHGKARDARLPSLRPAGRRHEGVATGFSAGIDSYATLADFFYSPDVPDRHRISHLLFNNVGSHGRGGRRLWRQRADRLRNLADRIGLPFIEVDSNLADFNTAGLDFAQIHTPANASVAHLLSRGIGSWYYASAYPYQSLSIKKASTAIAHVDTITLPWMSTPGLELLSTGSRYSRVEKTRMVAEVPDAWTTLDVCVDSSSVDQCSRCFKCLRTMATLDILGRLGRFESRFDLAFWEGARDAYLAGVVLRRDALTLEIRDLIREQKYPFSKSGVYGNIPRHLAYDAYREVRRAARKSLRN